MEIILQSLQSFTGYVVPIVVLLGLLIFVHELGHFLVAKYYKVKVEVFSLGFGPKIFTYQGEETQYAISAIPLGGYVKMFGHDPEETIPESEKEKSFMSKPVGQRIAIVLAGPLMNLFFAALLFMIVAFVGDRALEPQIGDVPLDSRAYQVGFRSGDKILTFNGQAVAQWSEFQDLLEGHEEVAVEVQVQRSLSSEVVTLNFQTQSLPSDHILSMKKNTGGVEGLTPLSKASLVGVDSPQSPAGQAGLRPGDEIKKIDDLEVSSWRELTRVLAQKSGQDVSLTVARSADLYDPAADVETLVLQMQIPGISQNDYREWYAGDLGREHHDTLEAEKTSLDFMAELGIRPSDTFVGRVSPDSPADSIGIVPGDRIVSIGGTSIESFRDILSRVSAYDESQGPLEITVLRAGETKILSVVPSLEQPDRRSGNYNSRYVVGVQPMQKSIEPPDFVWRTSNPVEAAYKGVEGAWVWTQLTLVSFYKLITNEVSPKNLGGVVSIGQMAQKSWEHGISKFLTAMAILSINLFIINLLPVPVLDGGHLLFYTIEAIRGAPLSMRKLEIAQQVGLVMLLFLMAYALFNDFSRLFHS